MPLFEPRECIEPDAPDPTGLPLSAGHTDTTAALRSFVGQTGRLFADPAAGLRSGGIKPLRNQHPLPASVQRNSRFSPGTVVAELEQHVAPRQQPFSALSWAARTRLPRLILIRGNAC